ncbi:Larval serum protein 1 beta [Carabus blaptoides fortunei]
MRKIYVLLVTALCCSITSAESVEGNQSTNVECNADSKNTRYFGPLQTLARQVLGYTFPSNKSNIIRASALEHFETSLRDPMFYQFYNRIIHYLAKYKNNLPEYNETELKCPGVTINNVAISTLNTFVEKFEFEISNALYTNEDEKKDGFQAWAHQYRVNHEPFTYTINVTSDTVTNVAVRIFIGPKYDNEQNEIPFNENRLNFVEFDKFEHSLGKGENIIIRNSTQGKSAQDRINFRTLYQDVSDGLKDKRNFKHNMFDLSKNFVLPKGESNGRVYKIFIHISSQTRANNTSGHNIDGRSFGYPLDRQISDEVSFLVPNSYLFEERVYHNETHVI